MTGITVCFLRWRDWSDSSKCSLGHPARISGKGKMKTQRIQIPGEWASQSKPGDWVTQSEAVRSHQLEVRKKSQA